MKIKEILELDYRIKENQEIIQKELNKIKPLSKYQDKIPLVKIEKCLNVLCNKYNLILVLGFARSEVDHMLYGVTIQYKEPIKNIGKVYGVSIYELLSKAVLLIYSEVKSK